MKKNLLVVISLMVIMSVAMVAPVMAGLTGTSEITGNPGAAIDITVTGSISNWALAVGSNTNSTAVDLVVSSNKVGWTVTVKDALDDGKNGGTAGKMANWSGSTYASDSLAAALDVTGASVPLKTTGAAKTLSVSDQVIETGLAAVSSQSMDITLGQDVVYTDQTLPGSNVYRIIVTFTGSVA
jgi:hypothetical protein